MDRAKKLGQLSTGKTGMSLTFYSVRHPLDYDIPVSPRLLSLPSLSLHVGAFPRTTIDEVRLSRRP